MSVVTGYYRAIVTRNYPKAFGYLAPGATGPDGQKLTLGSFLQLARMLDGQGGPVTYFSVSVVQYMVVMTNDRVVRRIGTLSGDLEALTELLMLTAQPPQSLTLQAIQA
ncbi:MAG: hypothetical protein ABSB76_31165 [Streptosporangiaceae bacterium]